MPQENAAPQDKPTGNEPDFMLPNRDVIHEDNWEEYRARGFVPTTVPADFAKNIVGTENVYTGDAYDYEAGRPLQHKPGKGEDAYLSPDVAKRKRDVQEAYDKLLRELGYYGPGDPATN